MFGIVSIFVVGLKEDEDEYENKYKNDENDL